MSFDVSRTCWICGCGKPSTWHYDGGGLGCIGLCNKHAQPERGDPLLHRKTSRNNT